MTRRYNPTPKENMASTIALVVFGIVAYFICFSSSCCGRAHGQVLATAETLGTGKQAILLTENHQFVDGVHLNIAYVQYIRGLSDRFDLYLTAGETNIQKKDQAWLGVGGNLHLFQVQDFNTSLFNTLSLPVNARDQSSTLLLDTALVVSRHFEKFTPYTGVNALVPIGARERGLFTPLKNEINVPLGVFVPWNNWGVFLEGDVGHLKAGGLGLSYGF